MYEEERKGGVKNWCKEKEEKRKKKVRDYLFINGKREDYGVKDRNPRIYLRSYGFGLLNSIIKA